ncbi:tyrosine-type recombinase/integrase, partial [Chloroflexota bacterium]
MGNSDLHLGKLIKGFRLSCQAEGKSPNTISWYICFLAKFQQYLEINDMPTEVGQINKSHIREFIRYLQTEVMTPHTDRALSPATVQGYVRTLKAFFSWLEREEYVSSNEMRRVPVPKAPIKIINTFNNEQISKLGETCQNSNGNGHRDLTILLLLLDSGIRVSELVNIDLVDLNLDEGYIKISIAKGGRQRIVPIGSLVQ